MSIITSKHSLGLFFKHRQYKKNVLEAHYSIAKLEDGNILNKHIKDLRSGLKKLISFRKHVFITLNITKETQPLWDESLFRKLK